MRTHAVFLRLAGRCCVVVGGDEPAAAKARACVEAGGDVTVIAPDLVDTLRALTDGGRVRHRARAYRPGDLAGAFLVYASTHDEALIGRLAEEAARERALLNVVDVPKACTFLAPAVLARGPLQVAVGTGGESPGLAARVRTELASVIGPEYGELATILGAVRRALPAGPERAATLARLVDSPLLDLLRAGRRSEVDALLQETAGAACTLGRLGVWLEGEARP
jgi:siroheme synthase-like protein